MLPRDAPPTGVRVELEEQQKEDHRHRVAQTQQDRVLQQQVPPLRHHPPARFEEQHLDQRNHEPEQQHELEARQRGHQTAPPLPERHLETRTRAHNAPYQGYNGLQLVVFRRERRDHRSGALNDPCHVHIGQPTLLLIRRLVRPEPAVRAQNVFPVLLDVVEGVPRQRQVLAVATEVERLLVDGALREVPHQLPVHEFGIRPSGAALGEHAHRLGHELRRRHVVAGEDHRAHLGLVQLGDDPGALRPHRIVEDQEPAHGELRLSRLALADVFVLRQQPVPQAKHVGAGLRLLLGQRLQRREAARRARRHAFVRALHEGQRHRLVRRGRLHGDHHRGELLLVVEVEGTNHLEQQVPVGGTPDVPPRVPVRVDELLHRAPGGVEHPAKPYSVLVLAVPREQRVARRHRQRQYLAPRLLVLPRRQQRGVLDGVEGAHHLLRRQRRRAPSGPGRHHEPVEQQGVVRQRPRLVEAHDPQLAEDRDPRRRDAADGVVLREALAGAALPDGDHGARPHRRHLRQRPQAVEDGGHVPPQEPHLVRGAHQRVHARQDEDHRQLRVVLEPELVGEEHPLHLLALGGVHPRRDDHRHRGRRDLIVADHRDDARARLQEVLGDPLVLHRPPARAVHRQVKVKHRQRVAVLVHAQLRLAQRKRLPRDGALVHDDVPPQHHHVAGDLPVGLDPHNFAHCQLRRGHRLGHVFSHHRDGGVRGGGGQPVQVLLLVVDDADLLGYGVHHHEPPYRRRDAALPVHALQREVELQEEDGVGHLPVEQRGKGDRLDRDRVLPNVQRSPERFRLRQPSPVQQIGQVGVPQVAGDLGRGVHEDADLGVVRELDALVVEEPLALARFHGDVHAHRRVLVLVERHTQHAVGYVEHELDRRRHVAEPLRHRAQHVLLPRVARVRAVGDEHVLARVQRHRDHEHALADVGVAQDEARQQREEPDDPRHEERLRALFPVLDARHQRDAHLVADQRHDRHLAYGRIHQHAYRDQLAWRGVRIPLLL
ncbi:geranylgeranylglyceryl/heptaprenylglyceryl phosphate synthase [Babesia caballi]|uniref:Geranylgeranylglyceryl/heptaprenylglyceryl phosphate synthase n=1 Tax=Babesia caballi TaxID=5871 RepID=A0AAV4LSE0_BABCB|nr:geranylgeranylglyceryl/heptaprenylglyceryl phosphate synthase [Babesia caballi]